MARQRKMVWEDRVTMEDVEDLAYMKGSKLDILAAVVGRAEQKHKAAPPPPPPSAAHDGGEASSSKKRNSHDGGEASSSKKRNFQEAASSYSPASKKRKTTKCNPRSNKGKEKSPLPPPPSPPPPPPLPQKFERAIQDHARGRVVTAPRLVIQKKLYKTDVEANNNRLSIPIRQIRDDFLTAEEKLKVAVKKRAFEVEMVAPSLEWAKGMKLCQWDMAKDNGSKTSSMYAINGAWKDVVKNNGLREMTEVQLWCFRLDHKLCFALVSLKNSSNSLLQRLPSS